MSITADQEKRALTNVNTQLFIGGEWREASGGATLDVEDPSTGEAIASVADATPDDASAALDAACAAQGEWAAHAPRERGEILRRAYEAITAKADELALVMTLEMGKPLAESKAEIAYASEFFRWFAEEAVRIEGRYATAPNGAGRLLTMRQPVGPCYMITPWNFPMAMGTRKIGPAIAAGCTMVVKPAQQTPLSMLALGEILEGAGLPPGVLNIVTSSKSSDVSKPIIGDARLRKLSFTGSTEVGRKLIEQSAHNILRVSMELGGNAPFLVFDDADVDDAVEGAVIAKMRNIGEACTAANRFHVAEKVQDEFTEKLAAKLKEMPVGRGTNDDVKVGPLIDATQREKVKELVDDAESKGAQVVLGGTERDGAGYFFEPTVIAGVPVEARLLKEEIFGPVAPVASFDDEEAAVAAANDTEYGLVAYVYTSDIKRAFRVVEGLETGMVGLNQGLVSNPAAPFGGVKQSGFGREGGAEGIHEYLEVKYVAMNRRRGRARTRARRPQARRSTLRIGRAPRPARRGDLRRRAGAGRRRALHRLARRPAVGALRARARGRRARAALLHQLRQPQGPRARRQPGRRARDVVARPAAPAARRGAGRAARRRRVRRLLRVAPARFAARRLGVAAGHGDPRPRGARREARGARRAVRRRRPAPGLLGRLPAAPAGDRVLGGPRQPPARPHALPARRRRLAQRAAQPVVRRNSTAQMTATIAASTGEAPPEHADDRQDRADHGDEPGGAADLHQPVGALLAGAPRRPRAAALLEPAHSSAFEPAAILRRSSALSSVSSSTPCSRATSRSVPPLADASLTISAALS